MNIYDFNREICQCMYFVVLCLSILQYIYTIFEELIT